MPSRLSIPAQVTIAHAVESVWITGEYRCILCSLLTPYLWKLPRALVVLSDYFRT